MDQDPHLAAKEALQQTLQVISRLPADASEAEIAGVARRFRESLLLFGSSGDDNISCVDQIVVGRISAKSYEAAYCGLRLASRDDVPLSSLLHFAEGISVPREVSEAVPSVTQKQWDAALRLATLLCCAFEGEPEESREGA